MPRPVSDRFLRAVQSMLNGEHLTARSACTAANINGSHGRVIRAVKLRQEGAIAEAARVFVEQMAAVPLMVADS